MSYKIKIPKINTMDSDTVLGKLGNISFPHEAS